MLDDFSCKARLKYSFWEAKPAKQATAKPAERATA